MNSIIIIVPPITHNTMPYAPKLVIYDVFNYMPNIFIILCRWPLKCFRYNLTTLVRIEWNPASIDNLLISYLISHIGILMTFYLSIILDLQNFFHSFILQSWKLKRPQIQLRPHHFWTYTSNLTTLVKSVLKFMINGTTSILKS